MLMLMLSLTLMEVNLFGIVHEHIKPSIYSLGHASLAQEDTGRDTGLMCGTTPKAH